MGPFEFVLLLVLMVIGGLVAVAFILLTLIRGGADGKGGGRDSEETRMIQELHQTATRLESRIESLETLIVDREQKLKEEGPKDE